MAKLSLTTITSGYAAVAAMNANNDAIETAFENTLSRDGTSPNTMLADLDINSHSVINLRDAVNSAEAVNLRQLQAASIVTTLPSQTGNANKVLKTDGTVAGWVTISSQLGSDLSAAADKLPYFSGASTLALTNFAAAARSLLSTSTAAKGVIHVGTGSNTFAEKAAPASGKILMGDTSQSDGLIWTDYTRLPLNVNPNWQLDQINEGALYTVNTTNVKGPDGWSGNATGGGVFKLRTLADPDNAAKKCLEITCTIADASIAATDNYNIVTALEGYDVADLASGTASASQITVLFKVKSNAVTGTFGLAIQNSAANRRYIGTITINSANVEQDVPVTFTLDTSGTWLYTNGIGLKLIFTLAAGSNFQATAGVWAAGAEQTTSAQANFMSVNTNILYIKRLHVIPSGVALAYSSNDIQRDLTKAQRLWEKSYDQGTVPGTVTDVSAVSFSPSAAGTFDWLSLVFKVAKRAGPTGAVYSSGTGTVANVRRVDSPADVAATIPSAGQSSMAVSFNSPSASVFKVHWTADTRLS